jgi:hypothetical protein
VHHVVTGIAQPFGTPLGQRAAPVPSWDALQRLFDERRLRRDRERAQLGDRSAAERVRQAEARELAAAAAALASSLDRLAAGPDGATETLRDASARLEEAVRARDADGLRESIGKIEEAVQGDLGEMRAVEESIGRLAVSEQSQGAAQDVASQRLVDEQEPKISARKNS